MKVNDEDEMERFIVEQRHRIAKDREVLDKNPTSAVTEYIIDSRDGRRQKNMLEKEQIPPLQQPAVPSYEKPPTPQFLKLGESYLKQKQKLNDERKQDYRKALAEKQARTTGIRGKLSTTYEQSLAVNHSKTPRMNDDEDLGVSLPIRDHLSAKERLRLARNKEYNVFKVNKENEMEMLRASKGLSPRRLSTWATPIYLPNDPNNTVVSPSKEGDKEGATTYEDLLQKKRRQEKNYRKDDDFETVVYREKSRKKEFDEEIPSYRRVRPQRKFVQGRFYDDDSLDESEEELVRKIRARRKKRLTQHFVESEEDDDDDDAILEKSHRREVKEGRRRLNSAQSRDTKMIVSEKQNDLRSKSAPPDQEYTGLQIGQVQSANTIQRRKDEYKLELQRQMEQNTINKRREKELELQIDASGANDPEKKPNRIVDLSPRQRKVADKRSDGPQGGSKEKSKLGKKKATFQQNSSDNESEEDDRRHRHWFPRQPSGYYLPPPLPNYYQPPQSHFPSPYDEAYFYYGARNPLDPPSVYGTNVQAPPGTYPGTAPVLAAVANRGQVQATTAPPGASTAPVMESLAKTLPTRINDKFESSLVADETRDSIKKKELMAQYQDELKQQMLIKEKKKMESRLEQERYDKKMEEEAKSYNPWGKGGGGAPMRDIHGKLVSDLRQMHIENEDLVRDPSKMVDVVKQRQQQDRNEPNLVTQESVMENTLSPRFGRNNPFEQKDTFEQKTQRDIYKEDLEKQIAERRREEATRKEKLRIEDEKQEQRMADQIRRMQDEYEEEKKKKQMKIDEQRRKNEELQRVAEERKLEEERKKGEDRERMEEEKRMEKERELQEKLNRNKPRSPPIRALENRAAPSATITAERPQVAEDKRHAVVYEPEPRYEAPRGRSPQVAAVRPNNSRDSKRISRELSALRKQLLSEQRRIENQLRSTDIPQDRTTFQPTRLRPETLVDLSMNKQRPVQVRRPPTSDRPSSKALREFSQFKNRADDTTSLKMFRLQHPETPDNSSDLERQQEDLIKTQMRKIQALKKDSNPPIRTPSSNSRNGFSLIPPESRASMLDADTTYIPIPDDVETRPPSVQTPVVRKRSARDRRRETRHQSETDGGVTYRAVDTYSLNSLNSLATLDVDRLANKNHDRLDKLKSLQGDDISLTDPDDILDRFVNQQRSEFTPEENSRHRKPSSAARERPPSVNTLDTEVWLRPGTTT